MPKGPQGQKRPADVIGNAVRVAKIATGEAEEEYEGDAGKDRAAAELGRKGGAARASKMTPAQRSEAARKAAAARDVGGERYDFVDGERQISDAACMPGPTSPPRSGPQSRIIPGGGASPYPGERRGSGPPFLLDAPHPSDSERRSRRPPVARRPTPDGRS
jgi:hypothetical protein